MKIRQHKVRTPLGNLVTITHASGPHVEISGPIKAGYNVIFRNAQNRVIIWQPALTHAGVNFTWAGPAVKYYVDWIVEVYEEGSPVIEWRLDLKGQKVLIQIHSDGLGDTLAWIPYAKQFQSKHGCEVHAVTIWNRILDYPDLVLHERHDEDDNEYVAVYMIGVFDNDYTRNKNNWRVIPLQQVATDALGLDYTAIRPQIKRAATGKRIVEDPYVAIAEFSTFQAKHWLRENGWQELVNFLNAEGLPVVCVSKEPTGLKWVIERTNRPIEETINTIGNAQFYIGASSGLSWLAWGLGVTPVIISGLTDPELCEMPDCVRLHNAEVCHGCIHDLKLAFDRGNWRWCPRNKNFECSTSITVDMVKKAIAPLIPKVRPGKRPRFSIIMPTKDRPLFIANAVQSILSQDYGDFELLIKDSGRSIKDCLPNDPRIHYDHRVGEALTPAFNRAMCEAKGEILNLASDDDIMRPGTLRHIHENIGKSQWMYGRIQRSDGNVQGEPWDYEKLKRVNIVPCPAAFWTRFATDIVGYWNRELVCADYDYWHRLAAIWEPVYTDMILADYTIHDDQDSVRRKKGVDRDAIRIAGWVDSYRVDRNCVLKTQRQIDYANARLGVGRWPHHPCDAKDWDIFTVLKSVDPTGDILDMGCANSGLLNALKDKGYGRLHGIDLRPNDYTVGDLCHTPFLDRSFDTITCLSVIEHGVDLEAFIKESWRLLRPGGKLLVTFDYWEPKLPPGKETTPLCRADVERLIALAKQAGFKTDPFDFTQDEAVITPEYHGVDLSYTFAEIEFTKPDNPKRKILFIAPHCSTGGMPQYLLSCVRDLKASGETVQVIEWTNLSDQFTVQRDQLRQICPMITFNGNKAQELKSVLTAYKPDVVHLQEFPEMFMDDEAVKVLYRDKRNYRIVETGHSTRIKPADKRIKPDAFVFVGDWHARNFRGMNIPYNIISYKLPSRQRPPRPESLKVLSLDAAQHHVLHVGLFAPWKNQAFIFEVAKLLPGIQFHFVGNQAPNFRDYWQPLMVNKPDNCRVWGERKDVDAFYSSMDLLLFPSTEECSPIVVREALSWQMPVIMRQLESCAAEFATSVEFIENETAQEVAALVLEQLAPMAVSLNNIYA